MTLKPCPFCGGKANLVKSAGIYRVRCDDCKAYGAAGVKKNDASEAWNKRVYNSTMEVDTPMGKVIMTQNGKTKVMQVGYIKEMTLN